MSCNLSSNYDGAIKFSIVDIICYLVLVILSDGIVIKGTYDNTDEFMYDMRAHATRLGLPQCISFSVPDCQSLYSSNICDKDTSLKCPAA